MKIFIYKSLIAFSLIFILFHVTIGYAIRSYEVKIYKTFTKDKITFLRKKIKEEIQHSLKKNKILSDEDALLLNKFILKLNSEIKINK